MTIVIWNDGVGWNIQDTDAGQILERVQTKQQAIQQARNKWAAPQQPIFAKTKSGKMKPIRKGSDDWKENTNSGFSLGPF